MPSSHLHRSTAQTRMKLPGMLRPAVVLFISLSFITGVLYPLVVTCIAQIAFPKTANGSLITQNGQIIGSELIGQSFSRPDYFWSRPSATRPNPYDASASGGSNLAPSNPELVSRVQKRIESLEAAGHSHEHTIPIDLITASASGLDPHISTAAAYYQADRIANARGLTPSQVNLLIADHIENRIFGFLGEPRVNTLLLNRALDHMTEN